LAPACVQFEWQRIPDDESRTPDSELRLALLGTWRLISFQFDLDGTLVKPFGENPQGYLVYTPDGHVFVQFATRAERSWPGPEVLEMSRPQVADALGLFACCGTFEIRDGQVIHQTEFGVVPSMSGTVEPRSVAMDGDDRLILRSARGGYAECQRITDPALP
jgi:hypothetical protein